MVALTHVLLLLTAAQLAVAQVPAKFLEEKLPLKPLVTTPASLLTSRSPVRLSGRQAITVVFSRPVIALGSDIADGTNMEAPFSVNCNVPGRYRWATTSIARFDPESDWPPDLRCRFSWPASVMSFDGLPLQLNGTQEVDLVTDGLSMQAAQVLSAEASKATNDTWDANVGLSDDHLPEVPPDGKLQLQFSYPVNLDAIQGALQVVGPGSVKLRVSSCTPLLQGQAAEANPSLVSDCAQVEFAGGLRAGESYLLELPAGSVYNPAAGRLNQTLTVMVHGLRQFRIPLRNDFSLEQQQAQWSGPRYRRLDLWLVHGLADNITVEDLKPLIRVCHVKHGIVSNSCTDLEFSARLVNRGRLQLTVPDLQPLQQVIVSVTGSDAIRDAFGLPLKPSETKFLTSSLAPEFHTPTVGSFALFDATPGSLTSWPGIARGDERNQLSQVAYWKVDPTNPLHLKAALKTLAGYYDGARYVPQELGRPVASTDRNSNQQMDSLDLKLDGQEPAAYLVHTCCRTNGFQRSSGDVLLLQRSGLQASAVMVDRKTLTIWVTSSDFGAAPLEGVVAKAYTMHQAPGYDVHQLGECTTSRAGLCHIQLDESHEPPQTALLRLGSDFLFVPQISPPWEVQESRYKASLVLDRKLVQAGDTLHIKGFLRSIGDSGLERAGGVSEVQLEIQPNFQDAAKETFRVVVPVDPAVGSFNASVLVPQGANPTAYYVQVQVRKAPQPSPKGRRRLSELASAALPDPGADPSAGVGQVGWAGVAGSAAGASSSEPLATSSAQPDVQAEPGPAVTTMPAVMSDADVPRAKTTMETAVDAAGFPGFSGSSGGYSGSGPDVPMPEGFGNLQVWDSVPMSSSAEFVVADPRPPTAELVLDIPKWAPPRSAVKIVCKTRSYNGAVVANNNMSLTWSTPQARGILNLTTDKDGQAAAVVDLAALPAANASVPGDALHVSVEWIGATRERIVQSGDVPLADGPYALAIARTVETDLPGIPFGVGVIVTSLESGSEVTDKTVDVTLDRAADNDEACADKAPRTCQVSAGAEGYISCQLALPCIGHYVLKACLEGACTNQTLGQNATEWKDSPWQAHPPLKLLADAASYNLGGVAHLVMQNPWANSSALLMWGNKQHQHRKVVTDLPAGPIRFKVHLNDECRGNCRISALLSIGRHADPAAAAPPGVPVSKLFDPAAAHLASADMVLLVADDKTLEVGLRVDTRQRSKQGDPVLQPGEKCVISFNVSRGKQPLPGAEVTIIAVDKALLDLLPYGLQDVAESMKLDQTVPFLISSVDSFRVASGAVPEVFATNARRVSADPWVPIFPGVRPSSYSPMSWGRVPGGNNLSPVDMTDEQFFAQYSSAITPMPSAFTPYGFGVKGMFRSANMASMAVADATAPMMEMAATTAAGSSARPAAMAMAAPLSKGVAESSADSAALSGSAAAAMRLQSRFIGTPLFTVAKVGADGSGTMVLEGPQKLGTYVIRAYAASEGSEYGAAEAQVVVRRTVSMDSALPRISRVGDTFEAGVVVTLLADEDVELQVEAQVSPSSPVQLVGADKTRASAQLKLTPSAPQGEVRFSFSTTGLGNCAVNFTAHTSAGGPALDALQAILPALPRQGSIAIATSFAIRATSATPTAWPEGLKLPRAEPGSGALSLSAGVGYLPSVLATAEQVISRRPVGWLSGYWSVAAAVLPSLLGAYRQPVGAGQAGAIEAAMADLAGPLMDPSAGLLYSPATAWAGWTRQGVDVTLNAWATWMVTTLPAPTDPQFAKPWARLVSLAVTWKQALERQVVQNAQMYGQWYNLEELAWARLALGNSATLNGASTGLQQQYDSLQKNMTDMSVRGQALLALALLAEAQPGSDAPAEVVAFVQNMTSRTRVGARTAYIAAADGSPYASGLGDQALSLLVMARSGTSNPLVQKLAAYVAAGPGTGSANPSACVFYGDMDGTFLAVALSEYDKASGSATPKVVLTAAVGDKAVLQARFDDASNASASSSIPWEALPPPPPSGISTLLFNVSGSGEVSVAASLTLVPADLPDAPTYRGIWVERALQLVPATSDAVALPQGPALETVPLGAIVALSVQITSPDDLNNVVIEVMVPSGLEPLDPQLYQDVAQYTCGAFSTSTENALAGFAGGAMSTSAGPFYDQAPSYYMFQRPWAVCPAQRTTGRMVQFQYPWINAGTQQVQFRAVAATVGHFVLPPVKVYVAQQPELMGLSAASHISVCASPCQPVASKPVVAPQPCPNNCNGHGVCNLSSGKCMCDDSFRGADCSAFDEL